MRIDTSGAAVAHLVADALQVVGERRSLLVVGELFFGVHRFGDIQVDTGPSRETVVRRLHKLEEAEVNRAAALLGRPSREEYTLTSVGQDLARVLLALRHWRRHVTPMGPALADANSADAAPALS